VLEGSVRRSGHQVRVNAQLIDAETDTHLWAERFDRDIGDLFALQSEITRRIANALHVELIAAEGARPTEHPDALDYILRGRAVLLRPRTPDTLSEAINLFERALALDPRSANAQSWLASMLVIRMLDFGSNSGDDDIKRADELATQAVATSPRSALARVTKGHVLRAQNRWEEAISEYQAALALNSNSASALHDLAVCKLFTEVIDEVIPLEEEAIRFSPRDPYIGFWYHVIGAVHLLQSRIDEAIVWLEKARSAMPSVPIVHGSLASAYALRDEPERAAAELAEARKLTSDDRWSSIARQKAYRNFAGMVFAAPIRALYEATYLAGLRKAGMPDE